MVRQHNNIFYIHKNVK